MASIVAGLAGGVVATLVMTIVMVTMGDGGPPPTAQLVARVAGGAPEDHAMSGMALHVIYGVIAGAVFAVGSPSIGLSLDSLAVAAGLGLVYGIVLLIGGTAFWMRAVIGIEPDREMMVMFGTVHVIYGVVLGVFLGADTIG